MAKVLVTGSAGFIGSHLCEQLLHDGHVVIGIDNMLGGDMDNVRAWANVPEARYHYIDCANFNQISQCVYEYQPEIIYICAAAPHEGLSVFSPAFVTKHTYLSAVATASAACGAKSTKRLVYLSSMARYGLGYGKSRLISNEFIPFTEDMRPNPVDPYGVAKAAAESVLECLCREHGVELVITVPHNIYGIRQRFVDPFRNVVGIMINRIMQGKVPVIYGDGEQRRCFSYIDDCIPSLIKSGFQDDMDGEIINIGPDHGDVSVNELCDLICRLMDVAFTPTYMAERPCEVKVAYCSSDKARTRLGFGESVSLENGLRKMIEWTRTIGPLPFQYHLPLEIMSDSMPETWRNRIF